MKLKNKFKHYKNLNIAEKRLIKAIGGYNIIKKIIVAEDKWRDKWIFNIFKNGFTVNYANKTNNS
jgi:hypothetical protein